MNFVTSLRKMWEKPSVSTALQTDDVAQNMRTLRFAMNFADMLVSMGLPARDIVIMVLKITQKYCIRRVYIDVTASVITLSQDREDDQPPITLSRVVADRWLNNMTIQSLVNLAQRIDNDDLPFDQAEEELNLIVTRGKKYPQWLQVLAAGGVSAGVVLLFTNSWLVIAIAFSVACLAELCQRIMFRRGVPPFFSRIAAATLITVVAAAVASANYYDYPLFSAIENPTSPTLIVVGGIIMLLMGMTFVSAIQDAIDEYYITASARMVKMLMMTTGLVIGIIFGLYLSRKLGFEITVLPDSLQRGTSSIHLVGAGVVAVAYIMYCQSSLVSVLAAFVIGMCSWMIYLIAMDNGLTAPVASAIAATFAGTVAEVASRRFQIPANALISAGIISLVPGLSVFNGLMQLVNSTPGQFGFDEGVSTLFTALAIAIAIGAGATLGTIIGRPVRQQLAFIRKSMPRQVVLKPKISYMPPLWPPATLRPRRKGSGASKQATKRAPWQRPSKSGQSNICPASTQPPHGDAAQHPTPTDQPPRQP